MTVREIRLHWPAAERALALTGEIVVTRDAKPVARIVPYIEGQGRKRWSPKEHETWLARFWRGQRRGCGPSTDELLAVDRDE